MTSSADWGGLMRAERAEARGPTGLCSCHLIKVTILDYRLQYILSRKIHHHLISFT